MRQIVWVGRGCLPLVVACTTGCARQTDASKQRIAQLEQRIRQLEAERAEAPEPDCPEPAPQAVAKAEAPPYQDSQPATKVAIGETAKLPDYALTASDVQECKVPKYFKPKPGNIKLGVRIHIEATGSRQVPVNPFYAKVTDSSGYTYSSVFGGCTPDLKSLRLSSGEKAEGFVTFEIPTTAKGLTLTYMPLIVKSQSQTVVVDLGR